MSLKETIDQDIKQAMKAKDQVSLRALRAVKSAILLTETAENRAEGPLSAEEEATLLRRQVKQRKDASDQFRANNRVDLAQGEEEELNVIEKYLPKQLSEAEVRAEISAIITDTGASSAKDMGKVMKAANEKFAGRADNKLVSELVKQLLS